MLQNNHILVQLHSIIIITTVLIIHILLKSKLLMISHRKIVINSAKQNEIKHKKM